MEWSNYNGWLEYESLEHPLYEHYDPRQLSTGPAQDGFDFKQAESVGYIRYWTNKAGDDEYILKVPRRTFDELLHDFLYEEGRQAIIAYEEWEYKDGAYIATRTVD